MVFRLATHRSAILRLAKSKLDRHLVMGTFGNFGVLSVT